MACIIRFYVRVRINYFLFVNYHKAPGKNNLKREIFGNQKSFGFESPLVRCFDGLLIVHINDWQIVSPSDGILTRLPSVPKRTGTYSDINYWGVFSWGPLIEALREASREAAQKGETSLRAFFDAKFRNLKDLRVILDDYPNDPRYLHSWTNREIDTASFLFS